MALASEKAALMTEVTPLFLSSFLNIMVVVWLLVLIDADKACK